MRLSSILFAALALVATSAHAENRMWHSDGQRVVDAQGRDVHFRGTNVGNWLMWKGWMFGGALVGYESLVLERLAETIGPTGRARFGRPCRTATSPSTTWR